jgi:hypothetical protein
MNDLIANTIGVLLLVIFGSVALVVARGAVGIVFGV